MMSFEFIKTLIAEAKDRHQAVIALPFIEVKKEDIQKIRALGFQVEVLVEPDVNKRYYYIFF